MCKPTLRHTHMLEHIPTHTCQPIHLNTVEHMYLSAHNHLHTQHTCKYQQIYVNSSYNKYQIYKFQDWWNLHLKMIGHLKGRGNLYFKVYKGNVIFFG